MRYAWIDDYFAEQFDAIAQRIGPSGVIISPHAGQQDGYAAELHHSVSRSIWRSSDREVKMVLRNLHPAIVVTSRPLQVLASPSPTADAHVECVVLGLSRATNVSQLGGVVDTILDASTRDGADMFEILRAAERKLGAPETVLDRVADKSEILELKPNIAGVGINLNILSQWYLDRRERRRGL